MPVISVEHLSKTSLRLRSPFGDFAQGGPTWPDRRPVGKHAPIRCAQDATRGRTAGAFSRDLEAWWAKLRGKHDVYGYDIIVIRSSIQDEVGSNLPTKKFGGLPCLLK